jgi:hypothetical protein
MTPAEVDAELRSFIAAVEGQVREPVGRSFHIHQLDGTRLEAMVYLEPAGVRIEWTHGKGDCAITGEGAAILAVLHGSAPAELGPSDGGLVLYGDLELVRRAPSVFNVGEPTAGGA